MASELLHSKRISGEVLVFRRWHTKKGPSATKDIESNNKFTATGSALNQSEDVPEIPSILKHTSIFHWRGVSLDIPIKKESHRILNRVDGWIKPGTLTALMVLLYTRL
jgi:ATP-binding cassette, subfamily G (WHITE), member 2, PDR